MVKERVVIRNPEGLHMRPAGIFAKEMGKFESDIYINFEGSRVNAKSILNIIAACIKCGSDVEIECEGTDENEALEKALSLIHSEFKD